MVQFNLDEDKFWKCSPAAAEIFAYRRENKNITAMPWGFDRGGISDDRRSTWACFSCVALSGWGKDELTISATMNEDNSWKITHAIKKAP
ncbi:MAG: hypothetical protein PHP23_00285 [Desulfobacterales bacterium]|nr:hypothetical protein [Desulfobacterales bacterium]MDD4073407.1 hypothetical protein [Desulfobacterales bacterium]MDD4391587.1 hypothetical protein [Desulfobacterales bacterium]